MLNQINTTSPSPPKVTYLPIISEEALDTTSKKVGGPSASRSTIGDSRQNLPPRPDTFSTPAPPGGPNLLDKIITPKVRLPKISCLRNRKSVRNDINLLIKLRNNNNA